jgi:holin-like protein
MIQYKLTRTLQQSSLLQALMMCLVWFSCDYFINWIKLPLSGGILGLGVILFLLLTQSIQIESIKGGAQLLLRDMLLFFIPAVLAVLEHHEFIGLLGLKILCVIMLSTMAVMLVTALVVDYCYHWRTHHTKSPAR